MPTDLLLALPIGLLGGALLFAAFARPERRRLAVASLAAVLALVAAQQGSHALRGYRSDLWMYLTMAARVAEGESLFERDPFWLEPPANRNHSLVWLGLGGVERATGTPALSFVPLLAVLNGLLLTVAAWRLAAAAFCDRRLRVLAVALFWAGFHQEWGALPLNRSAGFGCALLATALALDLRGGARAPLALAASIAAAFYLHLFGGVLALGGAALAILARVRGREPLPARGLALGLGVGVAVALPWLWLARPPEAALVAEHVSGPGMVEVLGLRAFHPAALRHYVSPVLLACAALALLPGVRAGLSGALRPAGRSLAWIAPLAVAAVLWTPLYHLATALFSGWMPPRSAALALLWIPGTAALAAAAGGSGPRLARPAAALLCIAVFWVGGARVVRDYRGADLYYPFTPAARDEARTLRGLLHGQKYASTAYLAYGLVPFTRGRPVAVPPGHGSHYHPFGEQARLVDRTLATDAPACWARLAAAHPDLRYLVTPAADDTVEGRLWRTEVAERGPAEVRATLEARGAAKRIRTGRHFAVDELRLEAFTGDASACAPAAVAAGPAENHPGRDRSGWGGVSEEER